MYYHYVAHASAHHIARVDVYDGEHVLSTPHQNVVDVEVPNLITVLYDETFKQIRILVGFLVVVLVIFFPFVCAKITTLTFGSNIMKHISNPMKHNSYHS